MEFKKLFVSINFDTLDVQLDYEGKHSKKQIAYP